MKKVSQENLMKLFSPVVPVIVTASSGDRIGGMPAAWSTPLSFIPPLVGVAIAPERYTYRLIVESGYFALNFVGFEHVEKLMYIGTVSARYEPAKLVKAGFNLIDGRSIPAPVLAEAEGVLECKLKERLETGDHDLFVGECTEAYASEDFDECWTLKSYSPILNVGTRMEKALVRRFLRMDGNILALPHITNEATIKRREVNRRILKAAKELQKSLGRPPKLNEISQRYKEAGLDSFDVELIAEQLRREGRIEVVR